MATSIFYSVGGPADTTAPTVDNFSPALGVPIQANQSVSFDVKDDAGLRAVVVLVRYPTGSYEVAWDGEAFSEAFKANSSRNAISGGHRYVIRRIGLWPNTPTLRIKAIDTSGNEAA